MPLHIAIVGSGPAGCFIAELLSRKQPDCQIDILEQLPVPFGLVRSGVAPDHQGTKNVTRQFERTLQKDNIRLLGNLSVGSDLPYAVLKQYYDLVIFATGAAEDRTLGLKNETLPGVYGSRHFVGWYNADPLVHEQPVDLQGPAVAIIGHGNVALDIARVLSKTPEEHAASDISDKALQQIQQAGIKDIYLIGRGGPEQSRFTPPELAELNQLSQAVPVLQHTDIPEQVSDSTDPRKARATEMNLELFRQFAANPPSADKVNIHLLFDHTPTALETDSRADRISWLHSQRADKTPREPLAVNTLIRAIGYHSQPIEGVPFDPQQQRFIHQDGCIEPGVYLTGWCRRGPTGVIPSNRADAIEISKRILNDLENGTITTGKPGPEALDAWLEQQGLSPLHYQHWQQLDQQEVQAAESPRPRVKFDSVEQMLSALKG